MKEAIAKERLHNALILVVDDVEINKQMLVNGLRQRGYTNVITAHNGMQALHITRERKPDLVILDLIMPEMDGFSYCQAIRKEKHFDNMPIIVQTALEAIGQKLKAFQCGASDYICKPVDPNELYARAQIHLTQKMLIEDLYLYRERTTAELEAARTMQNRLMPSLHQVQISERLFNMKIASYFETSWSLGGDCWGIRPLSENKMAVYMYDFSGHGVSAAMNVFRMHTIMQEFMHAGADPGSFLTGLNRHLFPLLERGEFATMCYAVIDTEANCLLYASAAAPPALLFPLTQTEPVTLISRAFPLGVTADSLYETRYTPFLPGELLLLYSDCLIETPDKDDIFLTEAQMKAAVITAMKDAHNPAVQSVNALLQLLTQHRVAPIGDDLTINAYWRQP